MVCYFSFTCTCSAFRKDADHAKGNWNAPVAITHSAILYAVRCMVGADIPLNQGAIRPIEIIVPDKSLLRPSPRVACCAGNVLTSQRIVDTIFLAFNTMAASQGCKSHSCSIHPGCALPLKY